jgi:cytochrome c biogenesis protein CcdA
MGRWNTRKGPGAKLFGLTAGVLAVAVLLAVPGEPRAEGEVRGLFFYLEGCDACQAVDEEVLPGIESVFPLELERLEVKSPANAHRMAAYERYFGVAEGDVPLIVFKNRLLRGEDEIREELLGIVVDLVAAGGSEGPPPIQVAQEVAAPATGGPEVEVVYFHRSGCIQCDRTRLILEGLSTRYPLLVRTYDAADPESQVLHERLDRTYGVPEDRRLAAPAVYVGAAVLTGQEVTREGLEAAVAAAAGEPSPWERVEAAAIGDDQAAAGILERYRGFRPAAVAAAGLLDGVNPCAFATLLFLLSYLTYTGRTRGEVLAVGLCFTLAVFLTYLATGFGLLAAVRSLAGFRGVARAVYWGAALLALGLGAANLYDFALCLRGRARDTALQLPALLKRRIHASIRTRLGVGATATAAFGTGAAVSLLELACTGQVYLPTLVFVAGNPDARLGAMGYLVLYNLAFILPLAAVFAVAYLGVSSRSLEGLFRRHVAWVKLGLAVLFLTLGGVMAAVA